MPLTTMCVPHEVRPDPEAVIKSIVYFCNGGNNTFLDEKLEQLRVLLVCPYCMYLIHGTHIRFRKQRQVHASTISVPAAAPARSAKYSLLISLDIVRYISAIDIPAKKKGIDETR
ncbi:MAG TPA: hypothetical protein VH500_02815 [Nitrososphaeraceae archaeon]